MYQKVSLVLLSLLMTSLACRGTAIQPPTSIPTVETESPVQNSTQTLSTPILAKETLAPLPLLWTPSVYTEPSSVPTFTPDKAGKVDANVTYCVADDIELKMDVYYPRLPATQKYPAIVYMHGGQFIRGDKLQVGGENPSLDGKAFRARGYVFISLNYRLGPKYKLPMMYEDVKCAIRHLHAQADSYNIDADRIGVIGNSSGSTLAAIIGLTDSSAGFDGVGAYEGVSSRVQAVVLQFPQVAFDTPPYSNAEQASREQTLPPDSSPEFLTRLNLYTYVSADDPPFMIFHGSADPALNPQLSEELNAELVAAGVTSTFILVHNGGHGWRPGDARKAGVPYGPSPSAEEILNQELDFFDTYLK